MKELGFFGDAEIFQWKMEDLEAVTTVFIQEIHISVKIVEFMGGQQHHHCSYGFFLQFMDKALDGLEGVVYVHLFEGV